MTDPSSTATPIETQHRARRRIRRIATRLTYANVMSTLAVTLAVSGGAAYAAGTIGSPDIIDNSIRSVDVRDDTATGGGLTRSDLGPSSVGSSEVVDGSVGSAELSTNSVGFDELAFGVLPQYTSTVQASTATDSSVVKEASVSCPAGQEVVGGGFVIAAGPAGGNVPGVEIVRSYAVSPTAWVLRAVATVGTPTYQLTVVANCIR